MHSLFAAGAAAVHSYHVPWFMYALVGLALLGYTLIEIHHTRKDHEIKFPEAVRWSIFYIGIALAFAIPVFLFVGHQAAGEYLAAWAIEKALSLDNLFVIGLIFASFNVPAKLERRMLNYGIAGAIFFRLIFILAGLELLKRFSWVSIIFGLILLQAAWKAFKEARGGHDIEDEVEITDKKLWKAITKVLPIHHRFVGHRLTTKVNGKRMLTLMAGVIILIELTDVIFAVDSVPAVLAVSPDRFIAYSSNVFALLGLRALFFVYQSVADKFWALSWALSGILAWISFKMIVVPLGLHVPIAISLSVLATFLFGAIFVSLRWPRKVQSQTIHIDE
ncbi:TerC/Alx family metal homeostasis membrane protein [Candidatus Saccharibacteria bacterium]|nr:MAG: TerC/Alx family metal homeostasis membrane protein [Candidatus Saccharibacteria bacterium]